MLYKNIKVNDVNPVVFLGKAFSDDYMENAQKVFDWLKKNGIEADIENPVDDLVFIYLTSTDRESIKEFYRKAEKYFDDVKINLHLAGFLNGKYNSVI